MLPWLAPEAAANPHSEHPAGWRAAKAIDQAREEVARLIGARPSEILFTSGATEANNLALLGASAKFFRIVVSAIEHPSVLEPTDVLETRGLTREVLPVDSRGHVDPRAVQAALARGPALVSVMAANNEIGSLQRLAEIGRICRAENALLHVDATQALTTQEIDVTALGIDLLSLSGHKLYGPQGVGALFLRSGLELAPQVFGGGQQGERRPGTLPTALCVGLGAACRISGERRGRDTGHLLTLREQLWRGLRDLWPSLRRNSPEDGLPGCLNVMLPGLDAADFLLDLPELAISTGSACSSLAAEPSHVLRAIGLSAEDAHASLRFGLGRFTTCDEVDAALRMFAAALPGSSHPVRAGSPPRPA